MGLPIGIPMGRHLGRPIGIPMGISMERPMGRPMGVHGASYGGRGAFKHHKYH